MRLSIAVAVSCLLITGLSAAEHAAAAIRKQTNIGPQGLGPALRELAKDHEFQILYRTELVGDRRTTGAVGEFTLDEALQKLLNGTNLTFQYLDDKTVTILTVSPGASPEVSASPAATSHAPTAAPSNETVATKRERSFWDRFRLAQAVEGKTAGNELTSQNSSENAPRSTQIEEMIVTAQKREERLQDVPIAISVLSGSDLDRSSSSGVTEALRTLPGITSYSTAQGGTTKFNIRGVSSNPSLFNGSSAVGYYLDEIPFGFVRIPASPDASAYDLDRVEALRGPQGTLYGANALNGVIRVITKDANLQEFEAKTRAAFSGTEDGGDNYRADMAVNVPIIRERLALRAVAGYADYSGWVDKPAAGKEDVNDAKTKNLRLKINAAPTDNLEIAVLSWFLRDDRGGLPASADDRTLPGTLDEPIETEYDAYNLLVRYEFPAFSVLSSTSSMDFGNDGWLETVPGVEALRTHITADLIAQEIRAVSTSSGPWTWSLGSIYRDAEDFLIQNFRFQLPGQFATTRYTSKSFAVFGELTRSFWDDRFDITAGLRYFEDEEAFEDVSLLNPAPGAQLFRTEDKFDAVTPRVVLNWRPNKDLSLYSSYSEGFRSGFPLAGAQLEVLPTGFPRAITPDRLHNYEVGAKGNVADHRFAYDVAVYFMDWEDAVQRLGFFNRFGNITFIPVNSKSASGIGVDVGGQLAITERLSVGATVSWNDLTFDENLASENGTVVYAKGSRMDESPELTAGLNVDYSFALRGGQVIHLSGGANHHSKLITRSVGTGAIVEGDDITVARASVGLEALRWSATLFGDNLTDEDGIVRPVTPPTPYWADRLRPRTIGIQVDYRF